MPKMHRFEVRPLANAGDPHARTLLHDAEQLGLAPTAVRTARVYLLQGDFEQPQLDRIGSALLANPVTQAVSPGSTPAPPGSALIEVHPLPGVMDPAAQSVADAVAALTGTRPLVSTAYRYEFDGLTPADARRLAQRLLANPVVHAIHTEPHFPDALPSGHETSSQLTHIPIRGLDDAALDTLSRDAHLFLSTEEMHAIRDEYRKLNREPTDIELETLAQTWSEHCVHKTLKSTIHYIPSSPPPPPRGTGVPPVSTPPTDPINWTNRPGHTLHQDGSVTIHNLLKSTVAAATHELIADGLDWTLSVFVDNAGIIAFDDAHAVCVKVETHNHPSAIEPYGGAATGIGGCIRDIIGTGLAAKPIASTDVFCVAHPDHFTTENTEIHREKNDPDSEPRASARAVIEAGDPPAGSVHPAPNSVPSAPSAPSVVNPLPAGCLPPERILTQIVAGVRDYGNRIGIPTVNGAVFFDDRYVANPLVYVGCVGVMPIDKIEGDAQPGDRIIALGGRTGRDGIHGATFSSAELTDTHADEFAHAVQIGNPIEEKRVLDAILRARDYTPSPAPGGEGAEQSEAEGVSPSPQCPMPNPQCLYSAITDCGAGGFSSAVGEMGEKIGATVHLDRAPLKYAGLTYTEIWISEAQERMVLAVPPENLPALQRICDEEHVELADLGEFGTPASELILNYHNTEVGRLPMAFLHDGIPTPTRTARWSLGGLTTEGTEIHRDGMGKEKDPNKHSSSIQSDKANYPAPPLCISVRSVVSSSSLKDTLLALLAHPNIASKHWIIRQYDHEVQGGTVLKPLVGPGGRGPGDAAVVQPVPDSTRGLAIGCGLGVGLGGSALRADSGWHPTSHQSVESCQESARRADLPTDPPPDPYLMALAAIDECVRNLVCVGADPDRIAILDNFCWPSCTDPENLGSLVRAAEGCYDGAKAYRTPFVSGKDSLNNQFTTDDGRTIQIPPTLLITGVGIVHDVRACVTSDAKEPGNNLLLVGPDCAHEMVDLDLGPRTARAVHELIQTGFVRTAHDVSDGGVLVTIAEMLIGGSTQHQPIGASLDIAADHASCLGESPSRYILEIKPEHAARARAILGNVPHETLGKLTDTGILSGEDVDLPVEDLARAWRGTLDW